MQPFAKLVQVMIALAAERAYAVTFIIIIHPFIRPFISIFIGKILRAKGLGSALELWSLA
jgi:hypothetical protein